MKLFLSLLVFLQFVSAQSFPNSKSGGLWMFALKDFSEIRFPAKTLPAGQLLVFDVHVSIDGKGRVHNVAISPMGNPFSDAVFKTALKWRFAEGNPGELDANICLGEQDGGKGIGLPCYLYGTDKSRHIRVLLLSQNEVKITRPFNPEFSQLAVQKIQSDHTRVLWAAAKVVIDEDGSVYEAQTSNDIVQKDLAREMKRLLRFQPLRLNGQAVEAVVYIFIPAPMDFPH